MRRIWTPCFPVVLALGLLAGRASAQETGHEPPPEAMTLFESARDHYSHGRYQEAADDLERALMLDPSAPTLLFNLGRVYELMGDYDRSIAAYEHLLTVIGPNAAEREQTETTLGRLRGARARATPPPTVEEVGSMDEGPTFVRERGVADEAFWAVLIGGGVVTLVAGGLGIGALTMRGQVDGWVLGRDGDLIDRDYVLSSAQGMGLAADVIGVIGGAAILGALGLFLFRERTYEVWAPRAGLRFDVGPTGAELGGTF